MPLESFLIALVVIGVVLGIISVIPFDETIKKIIYYVALGFIGIWAIKVFLGLL